MVIDSSKPAVQPEWWAALPTPIATAPGISKEALADMMRSVSQEAGKDYIVVDVRRTDFEDCFIRGAINLPAQSFHQTLPGLIPVLSRIPTVVFHCNSCGKETSRGRRVAGWYQDALNSKGLTGSKALYLEGGIKEWKEQFGEDAAITVKL